MQENGDFFAIFSLEDAALLFSGRFARVASYRLRAPENATSVFGDPAEVRGGALAAQFSERFATV